MDWQRAGPGLGIVALAVAMGVGLVVFGSNPEDIDEAQILWWKGEDPGCPVELDDADVDQGIALTRSWLLANQRPNGPFVSARDWSSGAIVETPNAEQQAIALWALARANAVSPDPTTRDAVLRGLAYWEANTTWDDARAWTLLPGLEKGETAGIAVATLAVEELLTDPALPAEDAERLRKLRDGWITFLFDAQTSARRVRSTYLPTGMFPPDAKPTAEADSAALAALVRVATTGGRGDLEQEAIALWRATWLADVENPRKRRRDPDVTKEFFPYGPIALRDLVRSDWLETDDAATHLEDVSVWMIDDHQTLRRGANTAYAHYALLAAAGVLSEEMRSAKIQCVGSRGLAEMARWMPGHARALPFAQAAPDEPTVRGGVPVARGHTNVRADTTAWTLLALLQWKETR